MTNDKNKTKNQDTEKQQKKKLKPQNLNSTRINVFQINKDTMKNN